MAAARQTTAINAFARSYPPERFGNAPTPRRMWRLRGGRFIVELASGLILFGRYSQALGQAWDSARQLSGS